MSSRIIRRYTDIETIGNDQNLKTSKTATIKANGIHLVDAAARRAVLNSQIPLT